MMLGRRPAVVTVDGRAPSPARGTRSPLAGDDRHRRPAQPGTMTAPRPDRGLPGLVRRRPVASFWLIATALPILLVPVFLLTGAADAMLAAIERQGLDFNTDLVFAVRLMIAEPTAVPGVLLSLAQVAAPDLAVLAVAALGLGRPALAAVRRRFRFWSPEVGARRGSVVWVGAVVLFVALNLASAGLHAVTGAGGFVWRLEPGWGLLGGLLVATFLDAGAVFEENGWRGFALPLLQDRRGPLVASVVLGVLWSAWHMPVKFNLVADYGVGGFLLVFAVLTVKFVVLSILITFFFNAAGEATIIAIALHGLSNDSVRIGGLVTSEAFADQLLAEVNLTLPMLVAAAVLAVATRGRLGAPGTPRPRGPRHDSGARGYGAGR